MGYFTTTPTAYKVHSTATLKDITDSARSVRESQDPSAISIRLQEGVVRDGVPILVGSPSNETMKVYVMGDNLVGHHTITAWGFLKTPGRLPGTTDPVLNRVFAPGIQQGPDGALTLETPPQEGDPDYQEPVCAGERDLPAGSFISIILDIKTGEGYVVSYTPYGGEPVMTRVDDEEFPEFKLREDNPVIPMNCRPYIFGTCQKQPNKGSGKKK